MTVQRARVVVGAVVLVVLGACRPPAPYEGLGVRTAIFGDSITHAATAEGRHAVAGKHLSVSWNAQPFLSTHHFFGHFAYQTIDPAEIVVVATGTNDANHGPVDSHDRQVIRDAMGHLRRVPCVLWVNTRSEISSRHRDWNALLVRELAGHANARILDWEAYSDADPRWIGPDNVHLSVAGQVAYASWLAGEIVAGCGAPFARSTGQVNGIDSP